MSATPLRLTRWLAFVAVTGAVAMLLAGRADSARLWAWLSMYWGVMLLGVFMVDEGMMKERLKRGQQTVDPVVLAGLRAFTLAHIVAGILDVGRFHWSDSVPLWLSAVAWAAAVAACAFVLAAVRVNRFFVPAVRIQADRGHRVVDTGPYALVRHPGYAGMLIVSPASGLALGSWLSATLGVCAAMVFAFRAVREDRFLRQNLEGYADYSARTRWRLVPGVF